MLTAVISLVVAGGSATASAAPAPLGLYVAQQSGAFAEFAPGATGNAVPAIQIPSGALSDVAVEPNGTAYLVSSGQNMLSTLPPGWGVGCECETLAGASTGLDGPEGVAVDSTGHIWVTNFLGNSIEEFRKDAVGDTKPLRTISGVRTGLADPVGIAVDPVGDVYTADLGGTLEEFAPGAHGNVRPTTTIAGALTTLGEPTFVALDSAGDLWVADFTAGAVDEFAPGATGDVAPVARIRGSKTGVKSPDGIAVDPSGVVYVSSSANSSIREFDSGRTGNVSPSAIISGGGTGLGDPIGLALAPAQKLLVQTTALPDGPLLGHYHARITLAGAGNVLPDTFSLTNLPPGLSFDSPTQSIEGTPTAEGTYVVDVRVSDSAARPDQAQSELTLVITPPPPALYATSDANAIDEYSLPLTSADQAPSRVVSGSRTGLDQPTGAALGSDGTLYVSNAGSNSVTEYAYGATGNETPVATISGADTGLDVPGKLAVDSSGYLFVTNNLNATVTEYAPGATGDAAPVATIGGFTRVGGIAAGDGVLEVGDSEDNIVEVYDDVSGAVSLTTTLGGTDTLLDGPTGLAIDGAGHLLAANAGGPSVTGFAAGAGGNQAPSIDITGPDTQLNVPATVAADTANDVFVGNIGDNTITAYDAGATGDAAPFAVLSGPDTQLDDPDALAVLP